MRWLTRMGYITLLLMLILASVGLPLYYGRIDKIQEEVDSIRTVRDLLMSITDAAAEARRLQRLVRLNQTANFSTDRYNQLAATATEAYSRYSSLR